MWSKGVVSSKLPSILLTRSMVGAAVGADPGARSAVPRRDGLTIANISEALRVPDAATDGPRPRNRIPAQEEREVRKRLAFRASIRATPPLVLDSTPTGSEA